LKFIDLSHPLVDGLPAFPSDPNLKIRAHATIAKSKLNLSEITMGSHQGTHLDAMYHFIADGKTIDQMPLDWFYGPARLIRIPKKAGEEITVDDFRRHEKLLTPNAKILFETGWSKHFGTEGFFENFPSMTQDAARYLVSRKIRLIGMDTPTPGKDWYEVHHILLEKPAEMVIVEALANLDQLPEEFTFIGFPLHFKQGDGSPIRAVALVNEG
jgi:arylformamidase